LADLAADAGRRYWDEKRAAAAGDQVKLLLIDGEYAHWRYARYMVNLKSSEDVVARVLDKYDLPPDEVIQNRELLVQAFAMFARDQGYGPFIRPAHAPKKWGDFEYTMLLFRVDRMRLEMAAFLGVEPESIKIVKACEYVLKFHPDDYLPKKYRNTKHKNRHIMTPKALAARYQMAPKASKEEALAWLKKWNQRRVANGEQSLSSR
jgi:hypothetical protein